jgi:hypothetical protein
MYKYFLSLVALLLCAFPRVGCTDIDVLRGTAAPRSPIALATDHAKDGARSIVFLNTETHRVLGVVLPDEKTEGVRNLVVSWNEDATKAAIMIYIGTKQSYIALYKKVGDKFQEIGYPEPDPVTLYEGKSGKTLDFSGVTAYSANSLGPWTDLDTVRLIFGKGEELIAGPLVFYAVCNVRIDDKGVDIKVGDIKGKLTAEASIELLKKWGERYWSRHLDKPLFQTN